jgi:aminopeptidase 2
MHTQSLSFHAILILACDPLIQRAFPSWDEPLLKAEYTIALVSKSDTVNLSNMPVASETPHGESLPTGAKNLARLFPYEDESAAKNEWKVTVFEKSPPVRCWSP